MRIATQSSDRLSALAVWALMAEHIGWKPRWIIRKYEDQRAADMNTPYEVLELEGNKLLKGGITVLWQILTQTGGPPDFLDNSNAQIQVGNGGLDSISGTNVTFTNGSDAVTGSGTSFSSELEAGDWIQLDADAVLYRVETVTDNTNIVLYHAYNETGGTGAGSFFDWGDTALAGGSTETNGMEASYPQVSNQTATFRAQFGASEANFAWSEIGVDNGTTLINRLVQTMGTKASPAVWTVDLEITLS